MSYQLENGVWYEARTEEGDPGRVTVVQHVDPKVDANDMEIDPELPVYSGPEDEAEVFAEAIQEGVQKLEEGI